MKNISNHMLLETLKELVAEERKLTAQILDHLQEVAARKLYLELGYSSLYDFCIKELHYSEGSAHRRISAMKLVREVPDVEEKILSGALSLSVISQAQTFFRNQETHEKALTTTEKREFLTKLENTSTRQCEAMILAIAPEMKREDKERQISPTLTELRLTVSQSFSDKIVRLKELLSHTHPDLTTSQLLELSLDALLAKKDLSVQVVSAKSPQSHDAPLPSAPRSSARYIPLATRREVFKKYGGQCSYQNPKSGLRCSGRKFLEIDHITPFSRNGSGTLDNLQLLCDAHNRWKGNSLPK
jgi:CRISPR/Cas system Type II protein with McrA/HNH and RuvC-like nuclease domain